ncbi:MAG: restriction endonuclease subunit S, partial [Polynucleobacter sp.]|nr:restriction endonuclease subunit S [Polynucleobacter sp.]
MMNAPRLRFKEFSDKFESVTLGKVSDFYKGKGIAKAEISEDGVTPCIRYGELYTKYGVIIEKALSRTNTPKSSLVLSQANDVIIPASGETQVDIATASCVMSSGIALGGDLNIIRSKQNGVFLSYYLNSKKKLDIAKLAQGNSVVHLYASQLRTLELNLPKFEEQKKIATFLSSVDQKITLLTKKYELLIQYKKGVMQKIFNQEIRFKDKAGKYFPEWKTLPLCEVAQIIGGGTPETSVQGNWGGDVQWFTPTELKQKYVSKSVRTITTAGLANSSAKLLPAGTDLFSSRATVGDVAIS